MISQKKWQLCNIRSIIDAAMKYNTEKIQKGDVVEFRLFFGEFYPTLRLFANKYLKDEMLAADVVQNAFIKFWDRKENFDNSYKIKAFLYTAIRNDCLNLIRNDKKYLRKNGTFENAESNITFKNILIEEESYRIFYNAVESLPKQCKKIIKLTLDGKKNSEIADILGIAEGTVHKQKKISYKKLKVILKEHYYLIS